MTPASYRALLAIPRGIFEIHAPATCFIAQTASAIRNFAVRHAGGSVTCVISDQPARENMLFRPNWFVHEGANGEGRRFLSLQNLL